MSIEIDVVDAVVCQMLDSMRNAHVQMVLGDPYRAYEYIEEAEGAHGRLQGLFHGEPANAALAGRMLNQVVGQRVESLRNMVHDSFAQALTATEVVERMSRPLDRERDRH